VATTWADGGLFRARTDLCAANELGRLGIFADRNSSVCRTALSGQPSLHVRTRNSNRPEFLGT
jgi:hypothetical protein